MFKKILIAIILIALLGTATILVPTGNVSAHRDGCHRWHSCPSDSGSYVCGDLGYTSGCGTSAAPTVKKPAIVRVPVKTVKTESKQSIVAYSVTKKYNPNEYPSYKKNISPGATGVSVTKTTIQLTDGTETSRSVPVVSVIEEPVDEVIEVGNRTKPVCRITKIVEMNGGFFNLNKGKYIAEGFCPADTKILLYQNDKKVSTAKSNKDGYFEFKKLKKAEKSSWLVINDDNGKRLSEKTQVTFTQQKYKTEYAMLHEQ